MRYEKEITKHFGLPSIPKKVFDGTTPFTKGVAVVEMYDGSEAYAACEYKPENGQKAPRVTKVFCTEPFVRIKEVFVVPNYMVSGGEIQDMDLDDESKKKAEQLLKEAEELENDGVESKGAVSMESLPEWIFDEIHNKEEAEAWLRSYNSQNRIKGRIPHDDETIKLRLFAIYSEQNKEK